MKQLFTAVIERLNAPNITDYPRQRKNNRLFEYVDIDWGQCDFFNNEPPPVKFPCALMDIVSANYSNTGSNLQIGDILIQVRVIDMVLSNSSFKAPDGQRERAFAIFDLISETNRLLHGWTPEPIKKNTGNFGMLTKQSFSKVNRRDMLKEYRLVYRIQLTDVSAVVIPDRAPAPKLTVKTAFSK